MPLNSNEGDTMLLYSFDCNSYNLLLFIKSKIFVFVIALTMAVYLWVIHRIPSAEKTLSETCTSTFNIEQTMYLSRGC